jgi:non-ribosomal peptide synthetase component E (peptide arylation enzyme)
MSCCGEKREQLRQATQAHLVPEAEENSPAYFQYTGKTGLTVMGPRTRKRYRFDSRGALVAVDPRDRHSLAAVPSLREVRKPTNGAK